MRISSEKVAEEQQVLTLLGQQREDLADVADEAHVQHPIGFVEHQHFDFAQIDGLLTDVVEQAAGGRDQNIDAAAQRIDLRVDADTAEHQRRAQRKVLAIGLHALFDLRREFAGRGQEQRADLATLGGRARSHQALQRRQREAGGLAGTGLGGGKHVAAFENQGNGLGLNGGRGGVTLFGHGTQKLGRQAKLRKQNGQ